MTEPLPIGTKVLITHPDNRRPDRLAPLYLGPYEVQEFIDDIYRVRNPETKTDLRYHATRVIPYTGTTIDPLQLVSLDYDSYLVERIIAHRPGRTKTQWQFKIRWDGYGPEDDSWIPYKDAKDLAALDEYLEAHQEIRLQGRSEVGSRQQGANPGPANPGLRT
ncbi:Chromo (CHRromatin Organization MOdifier) domain [Carpediemonas membranifera]|uniref:Chromo (CHRromatin Organization MOdifier) domain n=1 Tax=Carpediemonas membranifera TaxID=201153 RepID=A0A8J6ASE9_9EUKA|nr:Chromo (CHRromatin Organization MOdifier) domain [Carpediemonas membranifera]|eukprot:KAG9390315.1 Chromo (CHRromatin Organization MOdifier) domain [Carpediemonas membranifera]